MRQFVAAGQYGRFVLGCACGQPDCPATHDGVPDGAAGGPARVVINVIASADTLTGRSEDPGYLDGYGVIDASQVRDLAEGGALLRPTAAPTLDAAELLRHQPSAAVARWIRCRDLTCSFPGCNRPAWRADLDHSVVFDHRHPVRGGWTMPANLDAKCRQHHRLKTFHSGPDGWRDQRLPDGTVVWTSPTGRTYRSTPDGAELFPDIKAACAAPPPRRGNHRRDKTRRSAAAKAGMQAKRAANAETLWINRARAHEIDIRIWRNNVRPMHLVLNGQPSTSPWCTWVNNPLEDETITADWQPPPPPKPQDDDEPPF
ncbi:DUF222 domain-containing protein [Mycolicibacterium mengxianglii]|uniref:DUF222 domain-containing protein n=1 Tax=Mycolicibacterium mengxianglii TaxID=2736649 RepID=UPI0018D19DEC|nr:DUF222 domain-containing protein [Mycolicibacterium mengxianglii]